MPNNIPFIKKSLKTMFITLSFNVTYHKCHVYPTSSQNRLKQSQNKNFLWIYWLDGFYGNIFSHGCRNNPEATGQGILLREREWNTNWSNQKITCFFLYSSSFCFSNGRYDIIAHIASLANQIAEITLACT